MCIVGLVCTFAFCGCGCVCRGAIQTVTAEANMEYHPPGAIIPATRRGDRERVALGQLFVAERFRKFMLYVLLQCTLGINYQ